VVVVVGGKRDRFGVEVRTGSVVVAVAVAVAVAVVLLAVGVESVGREAAVRSARRVSRQMNGFNVSG
jgi:hypothetical protein